MPGDAGDSLSEELVAFEGNLARLEEVVATLEKGGTTLARSLELFEEGMALLEQLQRVLQGAEARIEELIRNADGTLGTRPLEPPR